MRFGLLALPFCLVAISSARAGVCDRPGVVEELTSLLRQAGREVQLDDRSVGELSTGTDRHVHCAMYGKVAGYDTDHNGMKPTDAKFVVHYTLELRQNGIFLALE